MTPNHPTSYTRQTSPPIEWDAPKRVVGVELESILLFVTRTFQRSTVKTRFLRILYVTDDIDESAEIVSHCIY